MIEGTTEMDHRHGLDDIKGADYKTWWNTTIGSEQNGPSPNDGKTTRRTNVAHSYQGELAPLAGTDGCYSVLRTALCITKY